MNPRTSIHTSPKDDHLCTYLDHTPESDDQNTRQREGHTEGSAMLVHSQALRARRRRSPVARATGAAAVRKQDRAARVQGDVDAKVAERLTK